MVSLQAAGSFSAVALTKRPALQGLHPLKFDALVFTREAYRAGEAGDISGRETLGDLAVRKWCAYFDYLSGVRAAQGHPSPNLLGPSL